VTAHDATSPTESEEAKTVLSPARPPDRLVLLGNDSILARRRPLAIVLFWAFEAALAAALVWPIASWIAGAYGSHPEGDLPLFRPGGLELFDLLFRAQVFATLFSHVTIVLMFGVIAGILPLSMLVVSLAYCTPAGAAPPLRRTLARAATAFPTFLALLTFTSLLQSAALGAGFAASSAVGLFSDSWVRVLGMALLGVFVLLACTLGVLHDLARAAAIRCEAGAIRAFRIAWRAFRPRPLAPLWAWTWRTLCSWLLVAMAAAVAQRFGGRAGAALVVLAVLHQIIALSRVALRASWLATCLRITDVAAQAKPQVAD
jgi:hypothetical protein